MRWTIQLGLKLPGAGVPTGALLAHKVRTTLRRLGDRLRLESRARDEAAERGGMRR